MNNLDEIQMSFSNDDDHRAALRKLFGPHGTAPVTPVSPNTGDILARIRQKSAPSPEPLRIIDSGSRSFGFGRFRFAQSFWAEFNREPTIVERESMETWAAQNCERGFAFSYTKALLYNATDWTLFVTVYK